MTREIPAKRHVRGQEDDRMKLKNELFLSIKALNEFILHNWLICSVFRRNLSEGSIMDWVNTSFLTAFYSWVSKNEFKWHSDIIGLRSFFKRYIKNGFRKINVTNFYRDLYRSFCSSGARFCYAAYNKPWDEFW